MDNHLKLTAEIVAAYVGNHTVSKEDLPEVIRLVRNALVEPDSAPAPTPTFRRRQPVVPEDTYDYDWITCLEDGKKVKLLKRYLRDHHQMTPEEYLQKWGLPDDYPLVAASYSEARSKIAKQNDLGKRSVDTDPEIVDG